MEQPFPKTAPLRAFVHDGLPDRPVVIVVHGIFDSNSNRYVRIAATALADQGFTVVVPDMRWHGCLYSQQLLPTVGLDEAADLVAWGQWLADTRRRPVGLLGFSLGALDIITAMAQPDAAKVFTAGGIAVSPPADMPRVLARLDRHPYIADDGGNWLFLKYFRSVLAARAKRASMTVEKNRLFTAFLEAVIKQHEPPFPKTVETLLAEVEPIQLLARIERPLLIIAAKNDPVMTETTSAALVRAAAPLAYVAVIETEEGGHIGHMGRDREWFVQALAKFFAHSSFIPTRAE